MKYNINALDFGRLHMPLISNWNSTDTLENYKPILSSGNSNLYGINDFDYRLNSEYFRCDDFTLNSELPILFTGCSITEGIGLPVEHTWCFLLLEKIRKATGKNIPFWNIGIAGTGIDTMARLTYTYSKKLNAKFLFALIHTSYRREFSANGKSNIAWNINNKWNDGKQYPYANSVKELFYDDTFSEHQTTRSCMILDSTLSSIGCKPYVTSWLSDDLREYEIFKNFPQLNYIKNTIEIPCNSYARDNSHPGPDWHILKSNEIWNNVSHYFI